MKLEQIDTSTTAGKAEVMQLAAAGRRVVVCKRASGGMHLTPWVEIQGCSANWDWSPNDFAIIAEPVGPDEVWVEVCDRGFAHTVNTAPVCGKGYVAVRYVRAD